MAVFDGRKGVSRSSNQEDAKRAHVSEKSKLLGSASEDGVLLELRGVALSPDTREHARKKLSEGVERGIMAAKVEEIVRGVVRGVRTPIREEEVMLIFCCLCNVMLNRGCSSLESPRRGYVQPNLVSRRLCAMEATASREAVVASF